MEAGGDVVAIFELAGLSAGLFAFFLLFFLPLGHLLCSLLGAFTGARFTGSHPVVRICCGLSLSFVIYGALTTALVLLTPSNLAVRVALFCVSGAALVFWIRRGLFRELFSPDVPFLFTFIFLYSLLCLLVSAFPVGDLGDISVESTMSLTRLPIDNLIPFNVSRYFVERIDPRVIQVVPDWEFADRGPLAGILNAALFIVLGIQERIDWIGTSPRIFFVYQACLTFLNALAILSIWTVSRIKFGRTAALWAIFIFSVGYFPFLNILFSWPKFFMCFLFLSSILAFESGRQMVLSGVFCAGALLAHDSALFAIFLWGLYLSWPFVHALFSQRSLRGAFPELRTPFVFSVAFLAVMLPWLVYKTFVSPQFTRLAHEHFFCDKDVRSGTRALSEGLALYLEKHSLSEILAVRGGNIVHPVSPGEWWESFALLRASFLTFISRTASLHFFYLFLALGVIPFLFFIASLFGRKSRSELLPYLIPSFGSIPIFGILSGCPGNTINHHCGYPAIALVAVGAGVVVAKSRSWAALLVGLTAALNVMLTVANFYYNSSWIPFRHVSPSLIAAEIGVFILLGALIYLQADSRKESYGTSG